jgi:hypothetical protein
VFIVTAVPKNVTFKYPVPLPSKRQAFASQAVFEPLSTSIRELEGIYKAPISKKIIVKVRGSA